MSEDEEPRDGTDKAGGNKKGRRGPKKATATYLENAGAHYLGRFAASRAQVRDVLMRKVRRSAEHHGTDVEEGEKLVDDILGKFERLGFLNDAAYAEMRVRSLHERGTPVQGIRYKLREKGVGADVIDGALACFAEDEEARDLDMRAAVKFAERRRLGPFSGADEDGRRDRREKDLAQLARAGFSYDVAERVLGADDAAELLDEWG